MSFQEERRSPILHLSHAQVSAAMHSIVPSVRVVSFRLASGGRANTNYIVETAHASYVLRFYVRDPELCAKEAALHALVENVVPIARILGTSQARDEFAAPFAVLEFVSGDTLEDIAKNNEDHRLLQAARALGHVLAALTHIRFQQSGDLRVCAAEDALRVQPWPFRNFYAWCLFETPAARRLGALRDVLWQFIDSNAARFEDTLPIHLVHGDFNPSNLLVTPSGAVAAVLDWEFAHAGKLWHDIGNLLRVRPELALPSAFEDNLYAGAREAGLELPENARDIALFNDLSSACEFLSSQEDKPETHARALRQIEQTLKRLSAH
jgi:aminoglycoside phosphotransferase (APT) family kinase protein